MFCLNVREQRSSSAAVMLLNNTHFPLMSKAAHSVFYQSHTATKDNIIFIRQQENLFLIKLHKLKITDI